MAIAQQLGVQQKQRRKQQYFDQHGRKWWANIEIKTGHPTGWPIKPLFEAPWYPEDQYVQPAPDSAEKPWSIVINYDLAIADFRRAEKDWLNRLLTIGTEILGPAFDHEHPTPAVIMKVGPKPRPWQPYLAAKQGNEWILGLSSVPDRRLMTYLDSPSDALPDFGTPKDEVFASAAEMQAASARELAMASGENPSRAVA